MQLPEPRNPQGAVTDEWLTKMQGREQLLERLFGMFTKTEADRLGQVHEAMEAGDLENARYLIHSIKGAAATMGAERLRQAAQSMENAIKQGEDVLAMGLLGAVDQEMADACARMRMYLDQGA